MIQKYTRYTVKNCDRIIAVSHTTKRDLIQAFPETEDKTQVIYEGVTEGFKPEKNQSTLMGAFKTYGISLPYILFVGVLDPKKNLVRLLEAFASFKAETDRPHQLVIVGRKTWYHEVLTKEVRRLRIEDQVVFTGHVPDKELACLYSGADVFVLPSCLEGFGLPVLEAMACGTPVIAADGGSLPEVVGHAGLLVSSERPDDMAKAIQSVTGDSKLRETLRERGFERTKQFSWEKTASQTLALYREVFTGNGCS
jgi:glycosyltransferase involved in cell wall biosynthesis